LLQESERAGTVERLAALFAGVAFFERIGVANNPALLRHGLLYSGSSTSHGNTVEAALLGPKVSTERMRWNKRSQWNTCSSRHGSRQTMQHDGEGTAHDDANQL